MYGRLTATSPTDDRDKAGSDDRSWSGDSRGILRLAARYFLNEQGYIMPYSKNPVKARMWITFLDQSLRQYLGFGARFFKLVTHFSNYLFRRFG